MLRVKILICPDCDHLSDKTMNLLYGRAKKVEKTDVPPCKLCSLEHSIIRFTIEVPINRYG